MTEENAVRAGTAPDISGSKTWDAPVGRVLYERFLIEGDLTPNEAAGKYSRFLAKDLRHFCRRVTVTAFGLEGDAGRSNAFQEICETLMGLDHPNIEWFLEAGRLFDGRPYAVSTYTSGSGLDEILAGSRRLVLERAAHIIESAGEALGAAHSRKIIHGGISPENFIVTPQQYEAEGVRLAGFGIEWPPRPADDSLADNKAKGFAYAAPELMTLGGRASIASDIYSLAAVAYRMLTGREPFPAAGREERLESIACGLAVRPSVLRTDLPADAESLIVAALQYKTAARPRDARAFARELAAELRGRPLISIITLPKADETPAPEPEKTPEPEFEEAVSEISFKYLAGMPKDEAESRTGGRRSAAVSDRAITWSLIVLLLAGALSIPISQTISQTAPQPQPVSAATSIVKRPENAGVPREIRYRIDPPDKKSPNEFRLTFDADSPGNAYVFSESLDDQGRPVFDVLYPLAKLNAGTAHIEPNQAVITRPETLGDPQNRPTIWLVWTAGRQEDLEAARRSAAEGDGSVRDADEAEKVKHFLERNKNNKLDLSTDNQQNIINGFGDRIVHRIDPGGRIN